MDLFFLCLVLRAFQDPGPLPQPAQSHHPNLLLSAGDTDVTHPSELLDHHLLQEVLPDLPSTDP